MKKTVFVLRGSLSTWGGISKYDHKIRYLSGYKKVSEESLSERHQRLFGDAGFDVQFVDFGDSDSDRIIASLDSLSDYNLVVPGSLWATERFISECSSESGFVKVFGRLSPSLLYGGHGCVFAIGFGSRVADHMRVACDASIRMYKSRESPVCRSLIPIANYFLNRNLEHWEDKPDGRGIWREVDDYTAILSSMDFLNCWLITYNNRWIFHNPVFVPVIPQEQV